jgi:hypothetical protein
MMVKNTRRRMFFQQNAKVVKSLIACRLAMLGEWGVM